jgi:hypothetical protein
LANAAKNARRSNTPELKKQVVDARREYGAITLAEFIETTLAKFGPFTPEQRSKLAVLLNAPLPSDSGNREVG